MAEHRQAPHTAPGRVPPWPPPDGGFDRIMRTTRRSYLAGAAGSALGVGGTNFVLGLTYHQTKEVWVGAAGIALGIFLTGVIVRRRLARNRAQGDVR